MIAACTRHRVHERADHGRLDDDEDDADGAERHDQEAEQEHQPGHGAPAPLVAHRAGQDVEHIGDGAEARVRRSESLWRRRR